MEINKVEIVSPWYKLLVDQNGRIAVKTLNDEVIMSSLTYFTEHKDEKENFGLKNVDVQQTNDSTIEIKGNSSSTVLVNIIIGTHKNSPKVDFQIKTLYNTNTVVAREALIASSIIHMVILLFQNVKMRS